MLTVSFFEFEWHSFAQKAKIPEPVEPVKIIRGLGSFSQLRQFRDRKTYELSPFLTVGTDFAKDVGEQ